MPRRRSTRKSKSIADTARQQSQSNKKNVIKRPNSIGAQAGFQQAQMYKKKETREE